MSRRLWLIVAVVVVVFAAGITVGVAVFGDDKSAGAVTLEPVASTGTDPFTSSVAVRPVAMPANVQAVTSAKRKTLAANPKTHTLVATGTAPGLYGGSGDTHVCDAQQLVGFLQQHPDKAAAWAGVLGITTSNIASYVATLTPVLLTNDTLVTNHGYRNGHATTLQSVLQAGTAVMVDSTGTPRVKCNCGNPLTPADPTVTTSRLQGAGWPGYAPTQVTVVNAGPVIQSFTLINVTTGATYTQPVGSASAWVAVDAMPYGSTSTILTSPDGVAWSTASTIPGLAVTSIAYGDGKWIASADSQQNVQSGTQILESTDLKTWTKVADNLFHIGGVAFGNGRWIAVGAGIAGVAVGGLNHASRVEYSSTDAAHWNEVDASNTTVNDANMQQLEAVAYGDGNWIAAGIDESDDPAGQANSVVKLKTFTGTDGTHWSAGAHWDSNVRPTQSGGGTAAIAHGASQFVVGASATRGGVVFHTSPNGVTWSDLPSTQFGQQALEGLAYGNGSYLAAALTAGPQDGSGPSSSTFYTSTDAQTWTAASTRPSFIAAVAFGPTPTTRSTSTPATLPASSPTCRNEFMYTAIKQVIPANAIPNILSVRAHCSGEWAYVNFALLTPNGEQNILVVHWNAATHAWEPAQDACKQRRVPPDLVSGACSGRGPGSSSTAAPTATTAPAAGGSVSAAAHCTKSQFLQQLQTANPRATTVEELWCSGSWAVVHWSSSTTAQFMQTFRWNGQSWSNAGAFVCGRTPPDMPIELTGQLCEHG